MPELYHLITYNTQEVDEPYEPPIYWFYTLMTIIRYFTNYKAN